MPTENKPVSQEATVLSNNEDVIKRLATPETSRVVAGLLDPEEKVTEEKKDDFKAEILKKTPDNIDYKPVEAISLDSRKEHWAKRGEMTFEEQRKEWVEGTKSWIENNIGENAEKRAEVVDTLKSLEIFGEDNIEENLSDKVEAYRHKYLNNESNIKQFVKDIADGCKDDQGDIDLSKLESRLSAIKGLLHTFGDGEGEVPNLIKDYATAHGLLSQKEEQKRILADEAYEKAKNPMPDGPEKSRIQRLHNKQQEISMQSQQEARDTEPSNNVKMGGESLPGIKNNNEDAIWFDEEIGAALVCDGVGKNGSGDRASQIVQESMADSYQNIPQFANADEAKEWLKEQILKANEKLKTAKDSDSSINENAGTTLTTTLLWQTPEGERSLIFGHIGDSRLSAVGKNGLQDLTLDQSAIRFKLTPDPANPGSFLGIDYNQPRPPEEVKELQQKLSSVDDVSSLTEEEAAIFGRRRYTPLHSVDGGNIEQYVETGLLKLQPGGYRLILRTDGITNELTDGETFQILKDNTDPQKAAEAINKAAGIDNKSAIVMVIKKQEEAQKTATINESEVDTKTKEQNNAPTAPVVDSGTQSEHTDEAAPSAQSEPKADSETAIKLGEQFQFNGKAYKISEITGEQVILELPDSSSPQKLSLSKKYVEEQLANGGAELKHVTDQDNPVKDKPEVPNTYVPDAAEMGSLKHNRKLDDSDTKGDPDTFEQKMLRDQSKLRKQTERKAEEQVAKPKDPNLEQKVDEKSEEEFSQGQKFFTINSDGTKYEIVVSDVSSGEITIQFPGGEKETHPQAEFGKILDEGDYLHKGTTLVDNKWNAEITIQKIEDGNMLLKGPTGEEVTIPQSQVEALLKNKEFAIKQSEEQQSEPQSNPDANSEETKLDDSTNKDAPLQVGQMVRYLDFSAKISEIKGNNPTDEVILVKNGETIPTTWEKLQRWGEPINEVTNK